MRPGTGEPAAQTGVPVTAIPGDRNTAVAIYIISFPKKSLYLLEMGTAVPREEMTGCLEEPPK